MSLDSLVCFSSSSNCARLDFPDEFAPNNPVIRPNFTSALDQLLKLRSFSRLGMTVAPHGIPETPPP